MGGDLNLKKSWHPKLMSNQTRVWQEEQKALAERKLTEQRRKEILQERQIEELQKLQEEAGGPKRVKKVDWMYAGPSDGQKGTTEEMEGYLLGKRRIDDLVKGKENKKLEKDASQDSFMALQNANTARDTASKIREDPMLAMKKQEQAAYEAIMNDPVRRRLLLKTAGHSNEDGEKERKHRKHRHRDDDQERRHKKRRRDSDGRQRDSDEGRRRDRDEGRRNHHHSSHRRRTYDDSRSTRQERSPPPYSHRTRRHSTSPSREYSPQRSPSPSRSSRYRRRSLSPRRKHHEEYRSHSPSRRPLNSKGETLDDREGERRKKLAAMQSDAAHLDDDRERRLTALAAQDEADREADEAARKRSSKYGGKGNFISGLNRKAGDLDLGERIRRGRGGLEKEHDSY
jgi:hypothetical protein